MCVFPHFPECAFLTACLLFSAVSPLLAADDAGKISSIPDKVWKQMEGSSWHRKAPGCSGPNCACPRRSDLVLLTVPYVDFSGAEQIGEIVVHKDVGSLVAEVFDELHKSRFPIERVELVDKYGASDDASMAANNTSAFNCRVKTSGKRLSKHSYGKAIDINPVQNPYKRGSTVAPPAGKSFDDAGERTSDKKGIILEGGPVTSAFEKRGWKWGGDWTSLKDYQHFSDDGG